MGLRLACRLLSLLTVLIILLSAGSYVAADDPPPPNQIFLWSSHGPVPVDRGAEIAASDAGSAGPERLLLELLEGPTTEEMAQGLTTAIPQGTTLADVAHNPDGTVIVRLEIPHNSLVGLSHEAFEVIVNQIGDTLKSLDWRDLRIQVRNLDGHMRHWRSGEYPLE